MNVFVDTDGDQSGDLEDVFVAPVISESAQLINEIVVVSHEDSRERGEIRVLFYSVVTSDEVLEVVVVESAVLDELIGEIEK